MGCFCILSLFFLSLSENLLSKWTLPNKKSRQYFLKCLSMFFLESCSAWHTEPLDFVFATLKVSGLWLCLCFLFCVLFLIFVCLVSFFLNRYLLSKDELVQIPQASGNFYLDFIFQLKQPQENYPWFISQELVFFFSSLFHFW